MYESFFGLRERAFDLTGNPRFLLLTPSHREALSNLEYGVSSAQGITLLIGEAGTGKTMVLRKALSAAPEQEPKTTVWLYLNNPTLNHREFLEFLAEGFGLAEAASKTRVLREIERSLRRSRANGLTCALAVDEAQSLPDELLEEIRLLANIESDTQKLLPIVLAGQPELTQRLNEWQLRQLKQRVALRCELVPLTLHESAAYIAGRVRLAGGDAGRLFSREAVIAIHRHSRGIPRTIGVIGENALITAFAIGRPLVDAEVVERVCRDFDLGPSQVATAASALAPAAMAHNVRPFQPAFARSLSAAWPNVARRLRGRQES
jgi:general secretion pathway protein A